MMYLGDFPADQAIYFMWNTNDGSGASITRATDGTLSVYKDNSDGTSFNQTQVTTGITNDEDVDGLTGVHSCCITTTNAWYETGHDYVVVLSASTIDEETVNAVIATFSIENRYMVGTDSAYTGTPPTVIQIRQEMDSNSTKMAPSQTLNDYKATGFNTTTPPTVGEIRTEMEGVGTKITGIKDKTDNIPASPAPSGEYDTEMARIDADVSSRNATTPPTVGAIRTEMEGAGTKLTLTLEDTAQIGAAGAGLTALGDTRIGNLDAAVSSRLAPAGTLATVTDLTNAPTAGDLTATMKTSVNDQVVDVIKTDTTAEMSQGAPPATPTFEEMIAYIYFKLRNKGLTTATEDAMYADDGTTKIMKATLSDNGTTFEKSEYVSGA